MENQTSLPEFILLGLSDLRYFRIPLVLFLLLLYLVTLTLNILIFVLVVTDPHLQTPMYFFLGNLSVLDVITPSIPAYHLPMDILPGKKLILRSTCVSQVFLFTWSAFTEVTLLAIMSYDRYIAISHPLHYTSTISIDVCIQLASIAWVLGFLYSLMHTLCTLRLTFCGTITIQSLSCELYQLIQLSCSSAYLNELLMFLAGVSYAFVAFFVTFLSYVYIGKTILNMKMEEGRLKAFSTCSSHLTVVFMFYTTSLFNYIHPNTKESLAGRLLSTVYTLFIPFLNPVIYSLRNVELKKALLRTLVRVCCCWSFD